MNLTISLPDALADFVEAKISGGRYASSSDVLREALSLMARFEQQESEKLQMLQKVWQDGIDSGDAGEIDFAALKAEARVIRASRA